MQEKVEDQRTAFIRGVLNSYRRSMALMEVVNADTTDTVTLDRGECFEVLSMHAMFCGYVIGGEAEKSMREDGRPMAEILDDIRNSGGPGALPGINMGGNNENA